MNETELRQAAEGATSISDILHRLNFAISGANYKNIKASCKKYNIPLPVYKGNGQNRPSFVPLEEILVENSTYRNSKNIKLRLYREGLRSEKCYKCGIGPEWAGEPLTLHLEHINGIHSDNRLDNLTILCPNCHSQTPTYCGRDRTTEKKISLCPSCSQPKDRQAKKCRQCSGQAQYRIKWPPIEEIIEEVKRTSYVQTGKRLGVSDQAVRKHIKRRSK